MADKISILINTKLNADPEAIQKQLDTLSKKAKLNIIPRINFDTNSIAKFKADVDRLAKKVKLNIDVAIDKNIINQKIQDATKEIQDAVKNASKISGNVGESLVLSPDTDKNLDEFSQKYTRAAGESYKLTQETKKFVNELGQSVKLVHDLDKETGDITKSTQTVTDNYKKQRLELEKINAEQSKYWSQRTKETVDSMTQKPDELKKMADYYKQLEVSTANAAVEQKKLTDALTLYKQKMLGGDGFRGELDIFREKQSSRLTEKSKDALAKLKNDINSLTKDTPNLQYEMKRLSNQFASLRQEAHKTSSVLLNALENAGKFLRFYLVGGVLVGFVNIFKGAIGTIYELDTAITDLKKVSDELGNSVGVKKFLTDVNKLAIEVGHSTKAAVESITEFKKLGYTLTEAQKLTEQALVYSNISDQNIQDATKSIISTLKGFSLGVEDVNHVMDAYNEVGNNFSITSAGIGEALRRSSSALYEAGNTLEESIGLVVAANASIQNVEKVGNALKTVSMRIRGISEESGEAIPKLDGLIKRITGVDIMQDESTFKSTYQIMLEISKVWEQLTDTDRATLLEALFGKHQGAVGASLLHNMADGVSAMNTAVNSFGSSAKEQARYMDSMQAKVNAFKESITKLWIDTIDSETLKGFVEFGTVIVNLIDKVGLLTTSLTGLWIYLNLSGKLKPSILTINSFTIAIRKLAIEMGFTSTAAGVLASTLTPLLAVGAIFALVKAIDALTLSLEEQEEQIASLISEIDELQSKYDELSSKTDRTEQEEKYLQILEAQLIAKKNILAIDTETYVKNKYSKWMAIKDVENPPKYFPHPLYWLQFFPSYFITSLAENLLHYYLSAPVLIEGAIAKIDRYNEKILEIDENNEKAVETIDKYNAKISEKILFLTEEYDIIKNKKEILEETGRVQSQDYKNLVYLCGIIEEVIEKREKLTTETEKATKATEKYTDAQKLQETVLKSYKDTVSVVADLNSALESLAENKSLTADETAKLIEKYPELIDLLEVEDGQIKITAKAIETLRQARIGEFNTVIETEKAKVDATAKALSEKLKMFSREIEGIQSIADAYIALEQIVQKHTLGYSDAGIRNRLYKDYSKDILAIAEGREKIKALEALANSTFDKVGKKGKKADKSAKDTFEKSFNLYETSVAQINDLIDNLQSRLNSATDLGDKTELTLELQVAFDLKRDLINRELAEVNAQLEEAYKSLPEDYRLKIKAGFTVEDIELTGKGNKELAEAIDNTIKLRNEQLKLGKELRSIANEFANSTKTLSDSIEDSANEIVDLYKDIYKIQKDVQLELVDKAIKKENDRHERVIDNLDKELDKYEEIINAKLKLIDEEVSEDDYQKELNKLQKERDKTLDKINVLSLDDSIEAKAQLAELNEQLAEQEENIEELKSKHTVDLRKKNLQNQLDAYKKDINAKKEAENKKYKAEKNRLEDLKDYWTDYYDNLINSERNFANIRQQIVSGMLEGIRSDFAVFAKFIKENSSLIGKSISENIEDKINDAQNALNSISKVKKVTSTNTTRSSSSSSSSSSINEHQKYLDDSGQFGGSANYIKSQQERYRKAVEDGNFDLIKRLIEDSQRVGYKLYHSGGIVGEKMTNPKAEQWAKLLLNKEVVLNEQHLLNIPKLFGNMLAKIMPIQPTMAGVGTTNINVHIDRLNANDRNSVDVFFTAIANKMKKNGI